MTGILKYWPADDRGEQILDELEERFELKGRRFGKVREYLLVVSGKADISGWLDLVDENWRMHIQAVTK